jgi:hypothetical protein
MDCVCLCSVFPPLGNTMAMHFDTDAVFLQLFIICDYSITVKVLWNRFGRRNEN